jgi:hypothetical protein
VTDTVLEKSDLHLPQDENEKESKIVAGTCNGSDLYPVPPEMKTTTMTTTTTTTTTTMMMTGRGKHFTVAFDPQQEQV